MRQARLQKSLGFLCWALLLVLGSNQAQAQTAQEIAKRAFGSTVLLVMEDANGQPISLGSGFFIRDGEMAVATDRIGPQISVIAQVRTFKSIFVRLSLGS